MESRWHIFAAQCLRNRSQVISDPTLRKLPSNRREKQSLNYIDTLLFSVTLTLRSDQDLRKDVVNSHLGWGQMKEGHRAETCVSIDYQFLFLVVSDCLCILLSCYPCWATEDCSYYFYRKTQTVKSFQMRIQDYRKYLQRIALQQHFTQFSC